MTNHANNDDVIYEIQDMISLYMETDRELFENDIVFDGESYANDVTMYSLSNYKHHIISDLFRIYESYDREYFVNAFRKDKYVIEDMFNLLIDHEMISKTIWNQIRTDAKAKKNAIHVH